MATYYTNSSSQRDAVPMLCLREPLPNSHPETPILPSNIALYVNLGYPEALSGNSQQQNNCFLIPSIGASHSTPEQHEILANIGGFHTGDHDFSAWREGRNEIPVRQPMDGQNLQGHGLSLSLGTQIPSGIQMPPIHDTDRNHNHCFGSFLDTNPSISGNEVYKSGSSRDQCVRHSGNLPPDLYRGDITLHGMSSLETTVPNTKYLKAAQQLLDEVVDIHKAVKRPDMKSHSTHEDSNKSSKEDDGPSANGVRNSQGSASNSSSELSHAEKHDLNNKLTKLLSMLDEVDSRYKQYYHRMEIVVSSFDVVAGCGASKAYTALALQTISRHFRCLRDAITGQISAAQRNLVEQDASGNNKGITLSRLGYVDRQIRQQRALQQLGMVQRAWRPQRGLPESSVSILRAWLFEHFLHPYPKDCDKMMLARQTGLTRSQVSNWFINARVRLWKPMIEEMYKQEICDADINLSSSSENAPKEVTKSDVKVSKSNDMGDHDGETEHRLVKQTEEQRPNLDDGGFIPDDTVVESATANDRFMQVAPTCQTSEFGRFKSGTEVSLTLALQHCEGGNFLPSETHLSLVSMREDDMYNAATASTIGAETAQLECISAGNRQQRFTSPSPHLLHDFVV